MQPPRRAAITPSLVIGLLLGLYGAGAIAMVLAGTDYEGVERWQMFFQACTMVQLAVLAYGAFALATRQLGAPRRVMFVVGALVAMMLVWEVARPVLVIATTFESEPGWRWLAAGGAIAGAVATILLAIGTRAWRLAPVAAVLALLTGVTSPGLPYVETLVDTALREPMLVALYIFAREAMWVGGALWMMHAAARTSPVLAEPRVVARGLWRAKVAIVLHAVAPVIVIVALGLWTHGTAKALVYPVVLLATGLLCMWSLLEVERGRLAGVPRVLYALGVTAIVWSCAMIVVVAFRQWEHAEVSLRYWELGYHHDVGTVPWSVVAPVIGLCGFVVVGISLTVHISRVPACAHLRGSAGLTISVMAACALFAGVMEVLASMHETMLALPIAGAIATILGLLVLARIVDGIASVIEDEPSLPVARLRSTSGLK